MPVSRLITPSSRPAKWTPTEDEIRGWLLLLLLLLGELLEVGLPLVICERSAGTEPT